MALGRAASAMLQSSKADLSSGSSRELSSVLRETVKTEREGENSRSMAAKRDPSDTRERSSDATLVANSSFPTLV